MSASAVPTSATDGCPPGAPNATRTSAATAKPRKSPPSTSEGKPAPRYSAASGHEHDDEGEDPAERAHEVGRDAEGERGDGGDVGHRVGRPVADADVDAETADGVGAQDVVEQQRQAPGAGTGEHAVPGDPHCSQREQHDTDREHGPDRAERVDGLGQPDHVAGEVVQGAEEVEVDGRLGLGPQPGHQCEGPGEQQQRDVGGAPLRPLVGVAYPGHWARTLTEFASQPVHPEGAIAASSAVSSGTRRAAFPGPARATIPAVTPLEVTRTPRCGRMGAWQPATSTTPRRAAALPSSTSTPSSAHASGAPPARPCPARPTPSGCRVPTVRIRPRCSRARRRRAFPTSFPCATNGCSRPPSPSTGARRSSWPRTSPPRRTPGSGCRRAATPTSRTSEASRHRTEPRCSTSTTSTRPAPDRSSGTSSVWRRASRSRPAPDPSRRRRPVESSLGS